MLHTAKYPLPYCTSTDRTGSHRFRLSGWTADLLRAVLHVLQQSCFTELDPTNEGCRAEFMPLSDSVGRYAANGGVIVMVIHLTLIILHM